MTPLNFYTVLFETVSLLFIVFSILGSSLIISSVLATARKMKLKLIDTLFLSLSFNDLFGAILNSFILIVPYRLWNTSSTHCGTFIFMNIIFTGCTVWHYVIVSTYQYLSVMHGARKLKLIIIAFVILSRFIPMLVSIPSVIHLKMSNYTQSLFECSLAIHSKPFQNLLVLIMNALIPLILITYCSVRIVLKVNVF